MPIVLLVEDNPGDARLISEHLRDHSNLVEDFEVVHVERVDEAVKILKDRSDITIILSDITLPDSRGEDTLSALNDAANEVPVIFMTGTNDEALAITAIHKGAQDYLLKGNLDGEKLYRAIQYAVERKKVQNEMNVIIANDNYNKQKIKLLAEQKRQLIRINHSKDEFISIASHQLRTPATAVKQYVGLLLEGFIGEIPSQQLELLERAYSSNERQLNVINELLKTAQLDSSKIKLVMDTFSLNTLIKGCANNVKPSLKLKNQTLKLKLDEDCEVSADQEEIKLVVDNLLENACKYTHSGKQIMVETKFRKHFVDIAVTDQGVGIDDSNLKLIFDKFSRIDNELSDTVQGSGLGLYWVKRIVRLHKGHIKVESAKGKGSKFTVSLPL